MILRNSDFFMGRRTGSSREKTVLVSQFLKLPQNCLFSTTAWNV